MRIESNAEGCRVEVGRGCLLWILGICIVILTLPLVQYFADWLVTHA